MIQAGIASRPQDHKAKLSQTSYNVDIGGQMRLKNVHPVREEKIEPVYIEEEPEEFQFNQRHQRGEVPAAVRQMREPKTEYGRMGQHLRVEYHPMFGEEVRENRERAQHRRP